MFKQKISWEIWGGENGKYRLKDSEGNIVDETPEDTCRRVATGLSSVEPLEKEEWNNKFYNLMSSGKMSGGGRIMANIGSGDHKKNASSINCVVLRQIPDSMEGIMQTAKEAALTLRAGCGVGYDFSTIRPKGFYVYGAGSETSGVISFMKIFDATCSTVMSGGCFSGDTRISTSDGLIKIEDIVKCDRDFYANTHLGLKKIVTKFDNGVKELFRVTLSNGQILDITNSHKLSYISSEVGSIETKPLSEFGVGEETLLFLNDNRVEKDSINLGLLGEREVFLNADLGYLLGLYYGDGSNIVRYSKKGKRLSNKGISIVFANDDQGLLSREKAVSVLKSLGLSPKINSGDSDCSIISVYSVALSKFLSKNGLEKEYASKINIPEKIFESSSEAQEGFISGFFDADGSAKGTKSGYKIAITSEQFSRDYQKILLHLGIASNYNEEERSSEQKLKGWKNLHVISIAGKDMQTKMSSLMMRHGFKVLPRIASRDMRFMYPNVVSIKEEFQNKEIQGLWARKVGGIPNKVSRRLLRELRPESNFLNVAPVSIKSIKSIGNANTYDLEVEGVHLLSGDGVYTSNSRRGAQLGALDIQHPEVESFITCKRQDGVLRYFNLSVLITDRFMNAVKNDENWNLWFWKKSGVLDHNDSRVKLIRKDDIPYHHPEYDFFRFDKDHTEVAFGNCTPETVFAKSIIKTLPAKELFDKIMQSTYDFAEPGFILVDRLNAENTLYFTEIQRASNPCGEQNLGFENSCLLGSMILHPYITNAFKDNSEFDWSSFECDVRTASRMLDNVVDLSNLPLPALTAQLNLKRRHGLGFTGLGSAFNMMRMKYGGDDSIKFTDKLMHTIAKVSLEENISLAKEKGCAPIFEEIEHRELVLKSKYLSRLLGTLHNREALEQDILTYGLRYSHATSIAPTGTMSLTWGNNCSNGLEPSFSNSYMRNIRQPGKKTKIQEEVMSYEYQLWREQMGDNELPEWWSITDNLSVDDHINIQAAVQKWTDAACSKTINIPTNFSFEDFKSTYFKGWEAGLKGVTTFRFNPEVFTGVLVRKEDLEKTKYVFITEDNEEVVVSGSDDIMYDGEMHNAANLFDALKEGLYGDM